MPSGGLEEDIKCDVQGCVIGKVLSDGESFASSLLCADMRISDAMVAVEAKDIVEMSR